VCTFAFACVKKKGKKKKKEVCIFCVCLCEKEIKVPSMVRVLFEAYHGYRSGSINECLLEKNEVFERG
jgi:hypothetical protein